MSLFDVAGKVVLITGSTRGIGLAIASRMAEAGARVVISSRSQEDSERVAAVINAGPGTALPVACNIDDPMQLRHLVASAQKQLGQVDVLVCNAAVNPHFGSSQDIPDGAFDKTLSANIGSVHRLCQLVLPGMAAAGGGSVILVSSIAGLKGSRMLGAYSVTKAANMQMARNLAVEWGLSNIRVNCIAPGLVRTEFARALWDNPQLLARAVAGSPLGRIGEPDEIAGAAIFLASDAASFITGQTIVIDGGATIAG